VNSSNHWKTRLDEVPGLEPYLRKVAQKWAKNLPLPKRMTLGTEPKEPAVRAALDRIFGGQVFYRNGKTTAEIPDALRNDSVLAPLAELLGIERKLQPREVDPSEMLQRLRLSYPQLNTEWLRSAPEIERLLRQHPEQENLLHQLLKAADYLQTLETPVTLSKLGSTFFNDSKVLRNGTPRKLLGGIMNSLLGTEDSLGNREIALQQFNVIDNPATTTATLFGPIDLIRNGRREEWIIDRFNAGEPVTLNSYNLQGVERIELPNGINKVITSENAAPFHELVIEQPDAVLLYTGGYPNAAVCRLLRLLAQAGATCLHWGDTDPDGFMIAALVDRYIETSLFRCGTEDIRRHKPDLKSLDRAQSMRGKNLLKTQSHFKFREELALTLELGHWLEQERWFSES
jgi:hypothetical protein